MLNDGLNTLVYDGENRATSATNGSSGTYTYDGRGMRVKKVAGATTTVYLFYGSKVIAEYDNGAAPTAPSREYAYSGSMLLAKIDSTGTHYYHQDLLSNRLTTDSSGNVTEQLGQYPFGESWYNVANAKLLFTSYERDAESGNDYAMARYYVNRLGRFSSTDLLPGSVADPQSLNRYAYVMNDPCNATDPSGLATCTFNVKINNNVGLNAADLTAALTQIQAIFGQQTDNDGNSVNVSFTSDGNSSSDYSINFSGSNPIFGAGHTWCVPFIVCSSSSTVYAGNMRDASAGPLTQAGTRFGSVGAHELITHSILQHAFDDCSNPNSSTCSQNTKPEAPPSLTPPFNAGLTQDQVGALFQKCLKLHPPNPHGGGGAGGAGQGPGYVFGTGWGQESVGTFGFITVIPVNPRRLQLLPL